MRLRPLVFILLLAVPAGPVCLSQEQPPASPATSRKAAKKKAPAKTKAPARKKRTTPIKLRLRRVTQAFVASADLKPMARQLLQDRTPAAYAGVEHYAREHKDDDAGALAWLVLGYSHILDKQHTAAIEPLKNAHAHAGELGDYVDYFLATAYARTGASQQVVATLHNFESEYPGSLLLRDALIIYGNALVATGQAKEAVAVLEAHRGPVRADVELALGRAYAAAGHPAKAVEVLRHLYLTMPLSAEADEAGTELRSLAPKAGVPEATFVERRTRAELLAQGRHWGDAIEEYRRLLKQAPTADLPTVQVALASALWHGARSAEAREALRKIPPSTDELNAQRLYMLLELQRPEEARVEELLSALRTTAPRSPWFQEGLLAAANMYLLKREYQAAARLYQELQERFPAGKYASYAHWKAAWLNFRLGKEDEAKRLFEDLVALYPGSAEVPPALYWRARLTEEEGDLAKARAYYQKLQGRFRHYYYAELARERLRTLPGDASPAPHPVLERIPPPQIASGIAHTGLPSDNLRAQKSLLLENGALYDLAIREVRAAGGEGGSMWALTRIAHLYQDSGRYDRAMQTLKRAVPGYFSVNVDELPRPVWEALFPRPYWEDMKKYALENQLDPFLVAALVRQESEFNPAAVSRANAIGLMQLLPGTGKKMARELKVHSYSVGLLAVPETNLQLGTRYFRQLLEKFDGRMEYALAAYNAGADRVEDWRSNGKYRDVPEFVESIPFTETREYVQAILRNVELYHLLYGTP